MPPDDPRQTVTSDRVLKWTVFLGATALIVYLCLRILQPFVGVLAWAIVLATIFNPLHRRLARYTGRPGLSAFITSLVVALVVAGPVASLVALVVDQVLALRSAAQQVLSPSGEPLSPAGQALAWISRTFQVDTGNLLAWVTTHASDLAQATGAYTFSIAAGITGAIVSFIFVIFTVFLLLRDGARLLAGVAGLLPFDRARNEALLARVAEVIDAGVYGIVAIALLQGALTGVMFWVLGVPSAAVWAIVAGVAGIVPLIGAAAVWAPGAVYLALGGHWTQAIVLAVWGGAVVSSVDNFLRPRLVGDRVGLHELVIFFALLGGVQLFGLLGIVLGPVLFAVVIAIADVLSPRTPDA
ncbi:MAG: AI-2E family transporter [Vicinamibacterales bacterium]